MSLRSLKSLPARPSLDLEFDEAVYIVALEGVTKWGLREAVRSILQGGLDHSFYPAAPEFRMHCNAIMRPVIEKIEKERREHLLREQEAEFKTLEPKSPEAKARASAAYSAFLAGIETDKRDGKTEAQELEEIRAKYDPELLAAIPDQPENSTFKQLNSKGKIK